MNDSSMQNRNIAITHGLEDPQKKRKLSSAFRSNSLPSNSNHVYPQIAKRIFIQSGKENLQENQRVNPFSSQKISSSNTVALKENSNNNNTEEIFSEICFVCETNLDTFTEEAKEIHLNQCLDNYGVEDAPKEEEEEGNDRGLRLKEFFCVLCDVNLSRKKLLDRCLHLKKCAKDHQMSTKQLLQFISPEEDHEDEEEDDDDDCDDGENGDSDAINGEKGKESEGKENGVIDLCSCSDVTDQNPPANTKNAFSLLMANSRQQNALLKGGFEAKIKKPSTISAKTKVSNSSSNSAKKKTNSSSSSSATAANTNSVVDPSVNQDFIPKPKGNRFQRYKKKATGNYANTANAQPGGNTNYAPAYKKIQYGDMTYPIVVDGFQYASSLLSDCYFLSHFHSDHYTGLTKEFNCGSIYCSPTTANLVKLRLKVHNQHLIALDLETKYTITVSGVDVEVIFTDANHCPGAVCIYFKFPNGRIVFHTGDFRWNDHLIRKSSMLRSLSATSLTSNSRNLVVYLDTTYCDTNYDFPHQDMVINAVVDCVREESKQPGAMFVFGAYSIGKERVFMAVAQELNAKVYVDTTRWKSMCCYDWPIEDKARLTTDPLQTNIWVVSMNQINFNHLETLKRKRPTCNRVIAFQPTGWTHSTNHPSSTASRQQNHDPFSKEIMMKYPFVNIRKKEGNTIYALPYSEHSSFSELIQFVRTFRPSRIIPTVNTSKEKVDAQIQLLKERSGVYDPSNMVNNIHPYPSHNENNNNTHVPSMVLSKATTFPHTHPLLHQPTNQQQQYSSSSVSFDDLFSSVNTENSIFL